MRNTLLIAMLFSLLMAGCGKEKLVPMNNVSATVDGVPVQFAAANGNYIKGTKIFRLNASLMNGETIELYVYLPSPGPLGTSLFRANGTNTAIFVEKNRIDHPIYVATPDVYSFSDENKDDLEGELTITKLDESSKLASGTFAFKTYNRITDKYITVTEGRFTDISFSIPPELSTVSTTMTCTASPSNEWSTKYVYSYKVRQSGADPIVTIHARTQNYTIAERGRSLFFSVPLNKGTGTFEVKAGDSEQLNMNEHTAYYNYYFDDYTYKPVPGAATITIHSLNEITRNLSMSFNMEMKNKDGTTVTFANGQLNANWLE